MSEIEKELFFSHFSNVEIQKLKKAQMFSSESHWYNFKNDILSEILIVDKSEFSWKLYLE